MAVWTHGTNLYVIAPKLTNQRAGNEFANNDVWAVDNPIVWNLIDIDGIQTFSPGGDPSDQIEVTTLKDTARRYMSGLINPSQASITLYFDPQNEQHQYLFRLAKSNDNATQDLQFVVGLADGLQVAEMEIDPATNEAKFDYTKMNGKRTWVFFNGYFSDFPFDFSQNSAVTCNVTITRVGNTKVVKKA